jgi:hypothetical protein
LFHMAFATIDCVFHCFNAVLPAFLRSLVKEREDGN